MERTREGRSIDLNRRHIRTNVAAGLELRLGQINKEKSLNRIKMKVPRLGAEMERFSTERDGTSSYRAGDR